ncbi:NAD(P)H-dependent flavin oxidoreductase [Thermodesulfobacteriota bacterium]
MAEERNPLQTRFCEMFGLEYPIAAFTHCPDTVYEVCNAGGLGVLGIAGAGFGDKTMAEEVEEALKLIKSHTSGVYGVDMLLPGALPPGMDQMTVDDIVKMIPEEHKQFSKKLREKYNLKDLLVEAAEQTLHSFAGEELKETLEVIFDYKVPVFAAALGSPIDLIGKFHKEGMKVISLVGRVRHVPSALAAGADVIVAQGYDAGGHTGEIGTLSLIPQVVDAVKEQAPDVPVLAAGGIMDGRGLAAALSLGAEGIWTGTIWQISLEHDLWMPMKQKILNASQDETLRQKFHTGKTARIIANKYLEEWSQPDAPATIGMPLQTIVSGDIARAAIEAEEWELLPAFAGQGTGMVRSLRSCRDIMMDYVEGALEVMEKFQFE